MSITIRYAENGDEHAIAKLLVAIHAQHAKGRPDLFGKGRAKYDEEAIRAMFFKKDAPIIVATEENAVVGYAFCQILENKNPAQGEYKTLYIDDINVSKKARRKGVGSALLSECRAIAARSGCYNVTLNVWRFNEGAIAFYEASGFSCQRMILESIL